MGIWNSAILYDIAIDSHKWCYDVFQLLPKEVYLGKSVKSTKELFVQVAVISVQPKTIAAKRSIIDVLTKRTYCYFPDSSLHLALTFFYINLLLHIVDSKNNSISKKYSIYLSIYLCIYWSIDRSIDR